MAASSSGDAAPAGGVPPGTVDVEEVDSVHSLPQLPVPERHSKVSHEDTDSQEPGNHHILPSTSVNSGLSLSNATSSEHDLSVQKSPRGSFKNARDGIQHTISATKLRVGDELARAKHSAQHIKAEVKEEVKKNIGKLARRTEHRLFLANTVPEVGVLVDMGEWGGSSSSTSLVPRGLRATMDVDVSYYGEPHKLLILRGDWPTGCNGLQMPAKEVLDILELIKDYPPTSSAPAWPLHDSHVSEAVMAMETEELAYTVGMEDMPRWKRYTLKVLRFLRITSPSAERVDILEEHYGPAVEFMFNWSAFFIQQLWILTVYAIICLILKPSERRVTNSRWLYETMKVGVVFWSAGVAILSTRRYGVTVDPHGRKLRKSASVAELSSWKSSEEGGMRLKRKLILWLIAVPILAVIVVGVVFIFTAVTTLILQVIFIWGDCLNLHSEDNPCRDATVRFGFIGWGAEVACDILLALLFELVFSASDLVSTWVAGLKNYRYQADMQLFKSMLQLSLAALERIGFVGCLAFFFVPQWSRPICRGEGVLSDCSCADFFLRDNDFRCFHRRLPVEMRRWLFESLMKGPFIVAPFVNIIVKVIIPKVVECIAGSGCSFMRRRCCVWLAPVRSLVRLLTLIFTYDGDSVKCWTYVYRGSPFAPLPKNLAGREKAQKALKQFKVKSFEVEAEMMELEMSFLWVSFFMPILPHGVMVTLLARLIEVNTDMTKLLFVRRRPIPMDDMTLRMEMNAFAWCVVVASMAWTVGLSLITYNDNLHKWEFGGLAIFLSMAVFMALGSIFATWLLNRCASRRQMFSFRIRPEETMRTIPSRASRLSHLSTGQQQARVEAEETPI